MKILVSNDDGYRAPGITRLVEALRTVAEVRAIAPDRDRSGASNALTLDRPLRAEPVAEGFYRVDGTPTDCVHLGLTGLIDFDPDMVVSGINAGANVGDDVLYSGTVAAAMEGRFLGLPSIAVSLAGHPQQHYETAVHVVLELIGRLTASPLPADTILNINVPDLPWHAVQGYRATRLGQRHRSGPAIQQRDPRGRMVHWVGLVGEEQDSGPGTDFQALREGMVSVTPILVDLTRHDGVEQIGRWLQED